MVAAGRLGVCYVSFLRDASDWFHAFACSKTYASIAIAEDMFDQSPRLLITNVNGTVVSAPSLLRFVVSR